MLGRSASPIESSRLAYMLENLNGMGDAEVWLNCLGVRIPSRALRFYSFVYYMS